MFVSASPSRRAWQRFKRNKLGYYSLLVFSALVLISLFAELVSNDKPLIIHYKNSSASGNNNAGSGSFYFPIAKNYPETFFGGDFETPTDYLDPYIQEKLSKDGNWAIYPINSYGSKTLNYFSKSPNPSAPSRDNWLGTDDKGRDLLAQLIYGFRVSVLFGRDFGGDSGLLRWQDGFGFPALYRNLGCHA
jgi:microcin C transport system permease protein